MLDFGYILRFVTGQMLCSAFKSGHILRFCPLVESCAPAFEVDTSCGLAECCAKEKAGALCPGSFGGRFGSRSIVRFPALQVVHRGAPFRYNEGIRCAQANEISTADILAIAAQRRGADPSLALVTSLLESIVFHTDVPPLV